MAHLNRKKFIIVEDFSDFRASLRKMLKYFGVEDIDEVSDGDAAVTAIARKPYDIILCDYHLGYNKRDGQSVLEEIKSRSLIGVSTVFMMVTAENASQMIMGALEYQPDDYLMKPFTREVLRSRLEKVIRRKNDFEQIEYAIQRKDYVRAIALCDENINRKPRNIFEFLRVKGNLAIVSGDFVTAELVYQNVLETRELQWARLGLGKVYFFTERYEQARSTFQSIINDNGMFVEAYDWLAKTLVEFDRHEHAQQVLLDASKISPKSILRQQTLGDLSYDIQDYTTSERSYKSAIRLGTHSCLKNPSNYTGLAKVLIETKSPAEAVDVLENIRTEFGDNADALLQSRALEGIAYQQMSRSKDALLAFKEVERLMEPGRSALPKDLLMGIAKGYFELGDQEGGIRMVKNAIRNHHEDDGLIHFARDVFKEANLSDEGERIITDVRKEIVYVNNKGVKLVEEGKLSEAVDVFEKAVQGLPGSKTINANAAQAVMLLMQKNGKRNEALLKRARQYMDRVKEIDPSDEKRYQKLLGTFQNVLALPAAEIGG